MDKNVTLTVGEQKQLERISADAERNKTDAQRLALDAGKLLTVTSERFDDYKNRGFFKRCWYKISGKQGSLDRANQADLISMQRFAWAYIVKLQEQNLLEAQAIAVIRNNLKDVQAETAEIHDMISVIVGKFDARIKKLEESTAMLDWKNHISATTSEFAVNKKFFCFLQLVFECLNVVRKNSIKLGSVRVEEYLYTAMKDLGLNPDAEWTVSDFISGLYEDVGGVGFSKFHQTIGLSVDGKRIESDYILNNVTGAGYNAVYQFDVEMANMQNISAQLTPEVAKKAMLETVRKSINNGSTVYSAKELAMEIVGGSIIAEEVYCEESGIKSIDSDEIPAGEDGLSIEDLLGNFAEISKHAFLEMGPTEEEKHIYIESFSLVFAVLGGYRESHYLSAMSKLFNVEESINRVASLSADPKRISLSDVMNVLLRDERKYLWILDAMMVAYDVGGSCSEVGKMLKTVSAKAFKLAENDVDAYLEGVSKIVLAKDATSFRDGIPAVDVKTTGWMTIADFKGLVINGSVGHKNLTSSSGGGMETVGIEFEVLRTTPFLPSQVADIVSYRGKWFVLDKSCRLWASADGRDWISIGLPMDEDGCRNARIRVVADTLVCWDCCDGVYCYTTDGCSWTKNQFPEEFKGWQFEYEDFFNREGSWYVLINKRDGVEYTYEDGLFIKTKKTGHCACSQLLAAAQLAGPWTIVSDNICASIGSWGNEGRIIVDRSICGLSGGFFALSGYDNAYCVSRGIKGFRGLFRAIAYSSDGKDWKTSRVEVMMSSKELDSKTNGFLSGFSCDRMRWNRFAFTPIGKGLVFTGCDATYYSVGGLSWRKVLDGCIGSSLATVGKYYCGFSYVDRLGANERCVMYYTSDGIEYKELTIDHRPSITCFKGSDALIVDESSTGSELYLGRVQIKRM